MVRFAKRMAMLTGLFIVGASTYLVVAHRKYRHGPKRDTV